MSTTFLSEDERGLELKNVHNLIAVAEKVNGAGLRGRTQVAWTRHLDENTRWLSDALLARITVAGACWRLHNERVGSKAHNLYRIQMNDKEVRPSIGKCQRQPNPFYVFRATSLAIPGK